MWGEANRLQIREKLMEFGAVLFRNFNVTDVDQFRTFGRMISGELNEYTYRSTPRTAVSEGVYTVTEYPARLTIPQHCENAYQRSWPLKLFFYCQRAAPTGGQTPLADVRKVTARIPAAIREEFDREGVMYVRNYSPGVDLPWQTVFQTENKQHVEAYCRENDIQFEWSGEALRTTQVCQGLAQHPVSGETVWFNQAHLFHASSLGAQVRKHMVEVLTEERLPRNAYYGSGKPIPDDVLNVIRAAFEAETVEFNWQAGDVLIVENMLTSHGRKPFQGERKIFVCMGEAYKPKG